ncbi:MAG TPA: hypothetical protein VHG88_06295 [Burkholderiales bacterium]|nr:hypothetical protein [Burkholderiales bacterium]
MTFSLQMARTAWLFSAALIALGFLSLLNLAAFVVWRFGGVNSPLLNATVEPTLDLVPLLDLAGLQVAFALAAAGVGLGFLGVLLARRVAARIDLEKQRAQDRLRRVHLYRESARVEPYLGQAPQERERKRA